MFSTGSDPVKDGLVASLNRPGGNLTCISYMNVELGAKRLGLFNELVPSSCLAVLVDPKTTIAQAIVSDLQTAASNIGRRIETLGASFSREIDASFASLEEKRCGGVLVSPMPAFFDLRFKILALAAPSTYRRDSFLLLTRSLNNAPPACVVRCGA